MLVLALMPAMRIGADLLPVQPIDRELSENLGRFIEIFTGWFGDFNTIDILEKSSVPKGPQASGRVGAYFSGGVDSFYTLLKHQDEITDLVYVHGFDTKLEDHTRRRAVTDMCRQVADRLGKGLVEVETNAKELFRSYDLDWGLHLFGTTLASVGHCLSSEFTKVYIASSVQRDSLFPWGSHPDTDPLLGGGRIAFVHDGCEVRRTEKIRAICEHKIVMDHLRVCFENITDTYNCGMCEKCLRTMISLYALGKLGACRTLPDRLDPGAVRDIIYYQEPTLVLALENLHMLEEQGLGQSPVYKALRTATTRPRWRAMLTKAFKKRKRRIIRFISRVSPFGPIPVPPRG